MKGIIIPLMVLLLFSCGRDVQLFHTENGVDVDACMQDNDYTIFCYIDSTNCAPCSMRWLSTWVYFEEDLKKMNTNVALIVQRTDEATVLSAMHQQHLNFPAIH
ncbi:MAG: hypothetical protein LBU91_05700 [Bacteroidales bacterium]|jgi:hypothetical protein|nr:hypothetical protein [Bacteroidales bacterium]